MQSPLLFSIFWHTRMLKVQKRQAEVHHYNTFARLVHLLQFRENCDEVGFFANYVGNRPEGAKGVVIGNFGTRDFGGFLLPLQAVLTQ